MRGEPADPISYERAIRELWKRLAAHSGFDLRKHLLQGADPESPAELVQAHVGDWLRHLHDEADIRIMGLVTCGYLKAWLADREEWTRPTDHTLRERLRKVDDMPRGLSVDRQELEAQIAAWWPELGSVDTPKTILTSNAVGDAGRRGRPPGSGTYDKSDAPLLLEMSTLLKDGTASSVHAASMAVAGRAAGGGTIESKARRLRDAYNRRWGKEL